MQVTAALQSPPLLRICPCRFSGYSTRASTPTARISSPGTTSASPHRRVPHSIRQTVRPRTPPRLHRALLPARMPPAFNCTRRCPTIIATRLPRSTALQCHSSYRPTRPSIRIAPILSPGRSTVSLRHHPKTSAKPVGFRHQDVASYKDKDKAVTGYSDVGLSQP